MTQWRFYFCYSFHFDEEGHSSNLFFCSFVLCVHMHNFLSNEMTRSCRDRLFRFQRRMLSAQPALAILRNVCVGPVKHVKRDPPTRTYAHLADLYLQTTYAILMHFSSTDEINDIFIVQCSEYDVSWNGDRHAGSELTPAITALHLTKSIWVINHLKKKTQSKWDHFELF